jgi:biopolymer transport protein ExbB
MAINAASKSILLMSQIRDNIRNGRDNAKIACAHSKSPVARLIEKGIQNRKTADDINTAIENGKLEIYKLEKNVSMLATISGGPYDWFSTV